MKILRITQAELDASNKYKSGGVDFHGDLDIEAGLGMVAFDFVKVTGSVRAFTGSGISVGWGISCKGVLFFKNRLFAGISVYRSKQDEKATIECGKLEGGDVCYGKVIERGLPTLAGKVVEVVIDGVVYEAVVRAKHA